MPKMNIIVIGKYKNYVWLFSHKQGNYLENGRIITSLPQKPTREETYLMYPYIPTNIKWETDDTSPRFNSHFSSKRHRGNLLLSQEYV